MDTTAMRMENGRIYGMLEEHMYPFWIHGLPLYLVSRKYEYTHTKTNGIFPEVVDSTL